jgi:hypothetical protein
MLDYVRLIRKCSCGFESSLPSSRRHSEIIVVLDHLESSAVVQLNKNGQVEWR